MLKERSFSCLCFDSYFRKGLAHIKKKTNCKCGRKYIIYHLREKVSERDSPILYSGSAFCPSTDRQANMRPHYQDRQCPICLMDARLAVETNCGHLFCGGCLSTYWTTQHPTRLSAFQCPYCRQPVSVLFPQFTAAELSDILNGGGGTADGADGADGDGEATPQGVTDFINTYNRRFSGQPRPWMDYVYDLPVILRHLASELFTMGGLAMIFRLRVLILVLGMLFYVVSPLDIIPEGVFGIFGLMDDLLFVFILVIYLSIQYRRVLAARGQHDHAE